MFRMTPALRKKIARLLWRMDMNCTCPVKGPLLCVARYGPQGCLPACVTREAPSGCDRKALDGWCDCPKGPCDCVTIPLKPCRHAKSKEKYFNHPSLRRLAFALGIRKEWTSDPITYDEWYEFMILVHPSLYVDPPEAPEPMGCVLAEKRVKVMKTRARAGFAIRHRKDLIPGHQRLESQYIEADHTEGNFVKIQGGLKTETCARAA